MTFSRFCILFFLCLSANVYSQIDYDAIAVELGYLLEENFDYNEKDLFIEKFNTEAFIKSIKLKDPEGNESIEDFNAEYFEEDFGETMYTTIYNAVSGDNSYKFINYSFDDIKNIYVLFRLYTEDGGVNYHQFLFEPSGIREYRITDVYFFLNGEFISETLQAHYYEGLENILEPGESSSEELKHLFALLRINRLINKGKIEKAKKIFYKDLSEEERNSKKGIFLEMKLTDVNDKEAYNAINQKMVDVAESGNPSLYLTAIDHFFENEQYQQVIDAVDSIYSFTNDGFLEIYKASAYIEMGDDASAEESLIKANSGYPSMSGGYDNILHFYETRNNVPKFLNVVDSMSKYLKIDFKYLEKSVPREYPQFKDTEEYKVWIAERMANRKIKVDSFSSILQGKWIHQGTEDFNGNAIETSPFGVEKYGNKRPSFTFKNGDQFLTTFDKEVYLKGIWDLDFAYSTLDFFVPFNETTAEGVDIIENGSYEVIEEQYYQVTSYYYYSIEEEVLKLYDRVLGVNIYRKEE